MDKESGPCGPTTLRYRREIREAVRRVGQGKTALPGAYLPVRILLGSCFEKASDRAAHTVLGALFGKASSKDLTTAELVALRSVLVTEVDDPYRVVDWVKQDMHTIVREQLQAAGQMMMELPA